MSQSRPRYVPEFSTRSTGSRQSEESQGSSHDSQSTAATSLYSSPNPSLHHGATEQIIYSKPSYDISPLTKQLPRSSTETYASTVESFEELCEEPDSYDPEYQVPEYREVADDSYLRPSNPSDFAEYFPTMKRLHICHDDTTSDGNWNLRVDAEDRKEKVQLFHLRMHDIKKRDFSLRRYERSSGREVCKSSRKYQDPAATKKPATLSRSVSNAFASIKKPDFKRTNSGLSTHSSKSSKARKEIKRQDSGYISGEDEDDFEVVVKKSKAPQVPTNTIKLEFSNYAQVEVKRRGHNSSKRYEFEYWGHDYVWKRVTKKDGAGKEVSFHLYKDDSGPAVARIVPDLRDPEEVKDEERNGGWVPPCSLWIHDHSVLDALTDVADVIVATGLIALVDDCIKRRFHTKTRPHQVAVPGTTSAVEFVTPRAMVEHMFKRRNSGSSSKSEREQRSSPLRYANAITAF